MIRQAILFITIAGVAGAHDVITTKITWSKEISRLVYKRCAACHAEGSSIPLVTYNDARPWAVSMKEMVLTRQMPPWQAVKGFADFKDDRGMTQEEMEWISDWVVGGAPEGDPKTMPPAPKPTTKATQAAWLDPMSPPGSAEFPVTAGMKLPASERVLAVRLNAPKGTNVQAVAARPDGTFAPLLWVYNFNPQYSRTYYYNSSVLLPAGTQIIISPPDAGKLMLYTAKSGHTATGAGQR